MEKKDHRELGRLMDLFSFEEIAPGAPFWHANGMIIFRELERAIREINDESGYQEISTPIMVKNEVFKKSGHWQHFRKNMFYFDNPIDGNEHLAIKPMNCPESTYIFNSRIRSYREMPLRLAEIGHLHRNELSGTLGGLLRVRQMTMDDAHIYCAPEQTEEEVRKIIKTIEVFYAMFNLKPTYVLATRPKEFLGTKEEWQSAEGALEKALKASKIKYSTAQGEGAFYGPKIEAHVKDSQNREWQLGTAQLDLVMLPKQFKTYYVDENGGQKLPWVIHRAIFGTFERFIGVILEHLNGHLPVWLSPAQTTIINVGANHAGYAKKIHKKLLEEKIRSELKSDNLTVGKRIREAEIKRSTYILVVGDKELKNKKISVRHYQRGDLGVKSLDYFIKLIKKEIAKKK